MSHISHHIIIVILKYKTDVSSALACRVLDRCIVHGPEKKVSKGKAGKAAKGKAKASADQPVSSGDPEPCTLFKNYKPAGGEAEDVFLARRVKGCVCGFSCKSFSRANGSFAANRTSMVDDASNSSVKTFRGTCDVLQSLIQEGQALRCCSRWQSQVQMGGGAHEVCRAPAEALASPTARFSDSKRVVQHTDQPRTGCGFLVYLLWLWAGCSQW